MIVTLKEKPWSRFAFPLAIFTLISIFSFFGGYINAEYSENFYVVKSNSEEYLVIEQVGDKFITVPIDLSTNEVTSEYIVIEQKSDLKNPVIFKKERLEGGIIVPSS
ncbi:hypothetical protein [Halobacillus halophilus]|uniref:hypothetical protein n=1 Tax=Halobacillus halophilus TaxID=1570 RepID=UPI0011AB8898|nr:hypothetical protein [Halobacillus halophilus]